MIKYSKISVNLQTVDGHFIKKGKDGVTYIALPFDNGGVVKTDDKGNICIQLVGFPLKQNPTNISYKEDIEKKSEKKPQMENGYPTTHAWGYIPDREGGVAPQTASPFSENNEDGDGLPF